MSLILDLFIFNVLACFLAERLLPFFHDFSILIYCGSGLLVYMSYKMEIVLLFLMHIDIWGLILEHRIERKCLKFLMYVYNIPTSQIFILYNKSIKRKLMHLLVIYLYWDC